MLCMVDTLAKESDMTISFNVTKMVTKLLRQKKCSQIKYKQYIHQHITLDTAKLKLKAILDIIKMGMMYI